MKGVTGKEVKTINYIRTFYILHCMPDRRTSYALCNMKISFHIKSRIPIFINTFFLLIFSIHAAIIGFWIIYPENHSTKVYKKDIKDLDAFPLSFKICLRELTNPQDRYSKIGYENIWSFFKGTINGQTVGWASQTENKTKYFRLRLV